MIFFYLGLALDIWDYPSSDLGLALDIWDYPR
jgi:hypothetical protein